jgi:hypothetical protein
MLRAKDDGGSKIRDGKVVLVFWGDEWTNGSTDPKPYIAAVKSILSGPYLSGVDQYGAGPMSYETEVFIGGMPSKTLNTATGAVRVVAGGDSDWMLENRLKTSGAPFSSSADPTERFYSVMIPPGYDLDGNWKLDPATNLWVANPNTGGWHGALPIDGPMRPFCVCLTGSVDGGTFVFTHELVEAMSSSRVNGVGIFVEGDEGDSGGEIGDVCFPQGGRLNGVWVSEYWSEHDKKCIVPSLADWQPIAPAALLTPGSLSLIRRAEQLLLFGLHLSEGGKTAELVFTMTNWQPNRIEATLDGWWTETPPQWMGLFTETGGSPFHSYDGSLSYAPAVNEDGAVRVYAIHSDGGLWQNGETVSPLSSGVWRGWSGWELIDDLGGQGWGVNAATDRSGRTVVFASIRTQPGVLRFVQQQPNSRQFNPPQPMDFDASPSGTTVARNVDGRLEFFALEMRMRPASGAYFTMRHQWEQPNGSWAAAADLDLRPPNAPLGHRHPDSLDLPVLAGLLKDGRMVVFAGDANDNKGWCATQSANPAWDGFDSIGTRLTYNLTCANQADGQLVLATTDEASQVWTAIERPKRGWRDWTALGAPGAAGQLLSALDRHDRIDLLAQLWDGSVVHARQQHPNNPWIVVE